MKKLGRYELLGELGRGAFGVVYRAKDAGMGRLVALKTLTGAVAEDPNLLERFYREARSAGCLQHPNIVTIHELGDEGGAPFIVMELVDGQNLNDLVAMRSVLPLSLKLAYCVQACRAFDYAHKRGIIHRDIKPGNVMVTREDVVKVVDFGIARVIEGSRTQTGTLIGTFAYMAPELYHGAHADERSDIWSFGVTLYEFLAYQAPFSGGSPAALMHAICQQEPARLSQLVPDCPDELEAVVHRALRKAGADRYRTMEDLLLDLDPIWKRVQVADLTQIADQARRLMDQNEFAAARDLLRQALRVDATHVQARGLLEKVNVELKRLALRPKAQEHVEKGRTLLHEGNLAAAAAEVDNALHLDSQFVPARELQQEIQREKERLQVADSYLQSAKERLVEGLPQEAEALLAKAAEIVPESEKLAALRRQVQEEKQRHQKRVQLQEGMRLARLLWSQQSYKESIDTLTRLQQLEPGDREIARLLETVREDQADQTRQERLTEARDLLAARRYPECIALLSKLLQEDPQQGEVQRLLQAAREDQAEQNKQDALNHARQLLASRQYDQCIALLTRLQSEFPREDEIERLLKTAREDQAEQDRRAQIDQARAFLAGRRYDECMALLTNLQRELPRDDEIGRLLDAVRKEQLEQKKQEKLGEARKQLADHHYEQCIALLMQLEGEFKKDTEVRRLLGIAREEQAEENKRQRLDEARKLVAARRYNECAVLLDSLTKDFPDDDEIARLLQTARENLREQERKQKMAEARDLLAAQRFADALAVLEPMLASDPKDSALLKLHALVLREQEEKARTETLGREWEALKGLSAQKSYAEVIARAENLLRQFPGEADLQRLLEFARNRKAQMDDEQRLRSSADQVDQLLQANRFAEAAAAARAALELFPGNPELTGLLDSAERREKHEMQRDLIERRVRDIKLKINRGQLSEARQLAREALEEVGPDTDVRQLLWSAEVEYDARERKTRQEQKLESVRALLQGGDLEKATAALDEILQSGDFDPLDPRLYEVGGEIAAARETSTGTTGAPTTARPETLKPETPIRAYVFREGPPAVTSPAPEAQAAPQPSLTHDTEPIAPPPPKVQAPPPKVAPAPAAPKVSPPRMELSPAAIDKAARVLARHIGPISGILAKRAAQRSETIREFYQLLAENVDGEAERASFLKDVGFSDL